MSAPIVVFAGPSLPADRRPAGPFGWRPPARAGDVVALLDDPPPTLCLIDGYFDWHPAPWHKELLLLMARGTRIFGASSMGALRAAELAPFGMIGVGAIFRAYRDGRLQGDDEVALVHATDELDWAPLSVPMVELRATLIAACRAGLVEPGRARRLRAAAREIHYPDRDWPSIGAIWREAGLDEALAGRIEARHVPLKTLDALDCLEAARLAPGPVRRPGPPPPMTCFIAALASARAPSAASPAGSASAPPRSRRSSAGPIPRPAGGGA